MGERLDAVRERLASAWEAVRSRSFWVVLVAATLAVIGVAVVVGRTASLRADAWRIRANEIRATGETVAAWQSELVPVAPAESAAWRRSERLVQSRAIDPQDRVALMQDVAQRAEALGITATSVGFVTADTLELQAVREVDGELFEAASYLLRIGLEGSYEQIAGFIGGLPPQVDVHRLEITGRDGSLNASLFLLVFVREAA